MREATNHIGRRTFGQTGREVTMVGLGGEGALRTFGKEESAERVIREAVSQGIGYFDSARAYAGSESYYGLIWPREREVRSHVFQTSKSASRRRSSISFALTRPAWPTIGEKFEDRYQTSARKR